MRPPAPKVPRVAKAPKVAKITKKQKQLLQQQQQLLNAEPPPPTVSFHTFLAEHRVTHGRAWAAYQELQLVVEGLRRELDSATMPPPDDRQQQQPRDPVALRLALLAATETARAAAVPTPEEMNRAIGMFLDQYMRQHQQQQSGEGSGPVTEAEWAQQFLREMYPDTSDPVLETVDADRCRACGLLFVVSQEEAMVICERCCSEARLPDATSAGVAYGDEVDVPMSTYKKVNHFRDRLRHLQVQENTIVQEDVMDRVMCELFKQGVEDLDSITFAQVFLILRDLQLSRHYTFAMQIWVRITGRRPLRLEPEIEEKFHLMFQQTHSHWAEVCPKDRRNFFSNPYFMYKTCRMLGLAEYLPFFTLLKGIDKLVLQECMFAEVCDRQGWEFDPILPADVARAVLEGERIDDVFLAAAPTTP